MLRDLWKRRFGVKNIRFITNFACMCYRYKLAIRSNISVYSGTLQQIERVSSQPSLLCTEFAMEDHGYATTLPGQTTPKKRRILPAMQC